MRQKSTDEFSKSFYKLAGNAVFGKMAENVRNRENTHVINATDDSASERLRKLVAKPTFRSLRAHGNLIIDLKYTLYIFNLWQYSLTLFEHEKTSKLNIPKIKTLLRYLWFAGKYMATLS